VYQSTDHTCYPHGGTIYTFQQFPPVIDYNKYRFLKHMYQIMYHSNYCSETFNLKPVNHCYDDISYEQLDVFITTVAFLRLLATVHYEHVTYHRVKSLNDRSYSPSRGTILFFATTSRSTYIQGYKVSFARNKAFVATAKPPFPPCASTACRSIKPRGEFTFTFIYTDQSV
jgi:hypothetical protein